MLHLNETLLTRVIAQARADVKGQPKWEKAIDRAVALLEENPWIERDGAHGLIIAGSDGTSYRANGQCSCKAYVNGMTHCRHRVLAKLVRRYDEAVAQQVVRPSYTQALADIQELYA